MKSEIIDIEVNELRIWSDNPRYGNAEHMDSLMDEATAINVLADVVGEQKMFALAKDIIEKGGLLGNTLPTVVLTDGLYLVYDGNRRISMLKALANPQLLEQGPLKDKIVHLVAGRDLSHLASIKVLSTDKDNALSIMDGTHSGERGGAGLIPWDAFSRDISLDNRGLPVLYPTAFSVAKVLGWKRKTEFRIPYTDLERLFSSVALKNEFKIKRLSNAYHSHLVNAVEALLAYKDFARFQSFSREFNTTKDAGVSEGPIKRFVQWHQNYVKEVCELSISLELPKIFEGDDIADIKSYIHVKNASSGKAVEIDDSSLSIRLTDPFGKPAKSFSTRIPGKWKCALMYDGSYSESLITVNRLEEPCVLFKGTEVQEGATLNLHDCVDVALSSKRNPMKDTVRISYNGDGEPKLFQDVLLGDTPVGEYTFTFTFDNDGVPYSKNKLIVVRPISDIRPGFTGSSLQPFCDSLNIGQFTELILPSVLAKEINDAWLAGKYNLAVCGMRAVLELSLDSAASTNKISFTQTSSLEQKVSDFVSGLLLDTNLLRSLCNAAGVSYQNERNFLNSLNASKIVSYLHLAAHKSSAYLNLSDVIDFCRKQLSHLISLLELLLR